VQVCLGVKAIPADFIKIKKSECGNKPRVVLQSKWPIPYYSVAGGLFLK